MELSQEAQQVDISLPADHTLDERILRLLIATAAKEGAGAAFVAKVAKSVTDEIMALLIDTGHVLPGCPPAAKILEDAKTFHERLTLSNLALRCFAMLGSLSIATPETKPAKRWNHRHAGPAVIRGPRRAGTDQAMTDWPDPQRFDPEDKRLLVAFMLAVWVLITAAVKGCNGP
jgi:hypothetical protein